MSRKLYKSLKAQKDQTEQVKLALYGSLGIPLNGNKVIQVADRQGYVYVRLRDNQNEVIQAFNNKVAASYDLPVIVVREGGRYVVQQYNSQRYQNIAQNSAPFLPGHGTQHSFPRGGGADITWVYGQQIMPALVYPESSTGVNVMVDRYPLYNPNGRWIYAGGTGTQNILQYIPTTGSSSLMALVYMDALTGNPGVLVGSGTYFPANITGSVYPYLPSPSSTQIPLAGVLLNTGTLTIGWDNIYDVRQWVHATPSGTSSGSGGIDTIGVVAWDEGVSLGTGTILNFVGAGVTASRSGTVIDVNIPGGAGGSGISGSFIQDEGIPKGFVTTFNFVGATIDASVSGSVARVFVTGSAGGAVSPPVTGSFVVQNNGTTLGSATILNFTNGVTASISGSVAQIQVTGTATYVRTAPPVSLSSVTGAYWRTQESIFVSGSLALFNQGHALIPALDYLEQYPVSGTFQYISTPPTGTYNLAIYGVPVAGGNISGGGGGSSSPAVVLPTSISGCVRWYDAAQEVGAEGAAIATITDRSASAVNLTQSTEANQAVLRNNAANGQPAWQFDGVNDYYDMASNLDLATAHTVLVVQKSINKSNNYSVIIKYKQRAIYGPAGTTSSWGTFSGGAGVYLGPLSATPQLVGFWGSSNSNWYAVNGKMLWKGASVTFDTSASTAVGRDTGGTQLWAGFLMEMIVFNNMIPQSDLLALTKYLHYKWGIPDYA